MCLGRIRSMVICTRVKHHKLRAKLRVIIGFYNINDTEFSELEICAMEK
jgi:hypothetical protein